MALLSYESSATVECPKCGAMLPVPFKAETADYQPDPHAVTLDITPNLGGIRAHLLLTHGIRETE